MSTILPTSPVHDEEILYRSILITDCKFEGGVNRISSSAFNDRSWQPSVDRAFFKNNNPNNSKKSPTDRIGLLVTKKIREQKVTYNELEYILDVKPDPEEANPAHAIIVPSPQYRNEKAFRKIKESLARLTILAEI